jgi:hypothetical protein
MLDCGLCGVKAVNGILSRNSWGHVALNPRAELHACPMCMEKYPNEWQSRLTATMPAGVEAEHTVKRDRYGRNWTLS